MRIRRRIYQIIEVSDRKDKVGVFFDIFLYSSILLNIVLSGLQSFHWGARQELIHSTCLLVYRGSIFFYLIEFLLRTWTCIEVEAYSGKFWGRLRFLLNPIMLIDGLVLLSYAMFGAGVNIVFMRSLRLFNLSQYIGDKSEYSAYSLLRRSVMNKKEELLITFFGAGLTLIICSYLIYYVEIGAQPQTLHSITPSIKWAFGVLTNTDAQNFQPVTASGKVIHIIMTVIGVLIIGLPLGIITGGFISEIEDAKKTNTLRQQAAMIEKAFSREAKIQARNAALELGMPTEARRIDLDYMSARLQFAPQEIFEIVRSSSRLRIRACKQNKDSLFEDNLIVEHFPANTLFGVKTLREGVWHVIATQNYSDPGIGHFSRMVAGVMGASYYSNEYFSSGDMLPEKRINFSANADYLSRSKSSDKPFEEWKQCLISHIKNKDWVIYLGTAGGNRGADFHVLCGGPKGEYAFSEIPHPTVDDISNVERFYQSLSEGMAALGLKVIGQKEFPNTDANHCSHAVRKNSGANVLTIYVNIHFLQFAEADIYYRAAKLLANEIVKLKAPFTDSKAT